MTRTRDEVREAGNVGEKNEQDNSLSAIFKVWQDAREAARGQLQEDGDLTGQESDNAQFENESSVLIKQESSAQSKEDFSWLAKFGVKERDRDQVGANMETILNAELALSITRILALEGSNLDVQGVKDINKELQDKLSECDEINTKIQGKIDQHRDILFEFYKSVLRYSNIKEAVIKIKQIDSLGKEREVGITINRYTELEDEQKKLVLCRILTSKSLAEMVKFSDNILEYIKQEQAKFVESVSSDEFQQTTITQILEELEGLGTTIKGLLEQKKDTEKGGGGVKKILRSIGRGGGDHWEKVEQFKKRVESLREAASSSLKGQLKAGGNRFFLEKKIGKDFVAAISAISSDARVIKFDLEEEQEQISVFQQGDKNDFDKLISSLVKFRAAIERIKSDYLLKESKVHKELSSFDEQIKTRDNDVKDFILLKELIEKREALDKELKELQISRDSTKIKENTMILATVDIVDMMMKECSIDKVRQCAEHLKPLIKLHDINGKSKDKDPEKPNERFDTCFGVVVDLLAFKISEKIKMQKEEHGAINQKDLTEIISGAFNNLLDRFDHDKDEFKNHIDKMLRSEEAIAKALYGNDATEDTVLEKIKAFIESLMVKLGIKASKDKEAIKSWAETITGGKKDRERESPKAHSLINQGPGQGRVGPAAAG